MLRPLSLLAGALVVFATISHAATFRFATDPFAGSTAPGTPGRQVVGGEPFITFDIATDIFSVEPNIFGISDTVSLANDVIENIPATGANFIVLQTFDNDNNAATPFNAGSAANLIADQVTAAGPGFFIYFNQGLDLPRLVYSTDLSANDADLKVIARLTNLTGGAGQTSLANFTAANFEIQEVPEPSSLVLMSAAGLIAAVAGGRRRSLRRQ